MTSSIGVHTRHNIHRFIRGSLVLKIKPKTGQTLGTMEKRRRRRNMAKYKGPNYDCNNEIFSNYEKVHNGGQTWHIFA